MKCQALTRDFQTNKIPLQLIVMTTYNNNKMKNNNKTSNNCWLKFAVIYVGGVLAPLVATVKMRSTA